VEWSGATETRVGNSSMNRTANNVGLMNVDRPVGSDTREAP